MATLTDLQTWRDALLKARLAGVRSVTCGNRTVDYRSDAEMQAAIHSADAEIAKLQSRSVKDIRFSTSKGT